jgi:hypothetical protein
MLGETHSSDKNMHLSGLYENLRAFEATNKPRQLMSLQHYFANHSNFQKTEEARLTLLKEK